MISLLLILIVSMTLIIYHSFNNIEGKKNKKPKVPKVKAKKVAGKIDKNIDKGVKKTTTVAKKGVKGAKVVAKKVAKGVTKVATKAYKIAQNFANLLNLALIRKAHKIFDGFVK